MPRTARVEHHLRGDRRFCNLKMATFTNQLETAAQKSAFTTSGSMRWSLSTTARVSPGGPTIDNADNPARLHGRINLPE
ncbi:MAG: hypothetical protein IPK89_02420 [Sphingomonadales bacterium]|nr:hypothetical protein [Sphingomonadales bacterium]